MIYKTATSSLSVHDYLSPLIVAVSLVLPRSLAVFVSCDILLALLYICREHPRHRVQAMATFTTLGPAEFGLRPLCSSKAFDCTI